MQLAEQLSSGDRELARLFQTVVSQTLGTIDQSFALKLLGFKECLL